MICYVKSGPAKILVQGTQIPVLWTIVPPKFWSRHGITVRYELYHWSDCMCTVRRKESVQCKEHGDIDLNITALVQSSIIFSLHRW